MDKTSLGDRMKEYEKVSRTSLTKRTPVIIRLDGKAFHTFTKRLPDKTPFSNIMHECMSVTTNLLVHYIQNACFAYTQSDEISILLVDWRKFNTESWYGNQVQKMTSVAASMATAYFNATYAKHEHIEYLPHMPLFDARVFTLPKEDVCNYFIWRQQDATRNSVNMLGQYHFSHKSLHGLGVGKVQDKLMLEKGINWNDLPIWQKRGTCVRNTTSISSSGPFIDVNPPIFTQDRAYIEDWLDPEYMSTMSGGRDEKV